MIMRLPSFLRFAPVPVRPRHDGWTPGLQQRFVLDLSRGASPAEAARRLGRSRQSAYALRRKPGAASFAAAWDAAQDFACQAKVAGRSVPLLEHGLDTILVPRVYRGRLVGFVLREDLKGTMRTLARLDRIADALDAKGPADFDLDAYLAQLGASAESEIDKADEIFPVKL
jgi:hypothetical protein